MAILLGSLTLGAQTEFVAGIVRVKPEVSVLELKNGSVYYSDTVPLPFYVIPPKDPFDPTKNFEADGVEIYYSFADGEVIIFRAEKLEPLVPEFQNIRLTLPGIEDGVLNITATVLYYRRVNWSIGTSFGLKGSATVTFKVVTAPRIELLALENQTLTCPDAQLISQ